MALIYWPITTLPPKRILADPIARNTSPTVALSGRRQSAASNAPAWVVALTEIPVVTAAAVNKWREIAALADGALNSIVVPLWRKQQPLGNVPFDLYGYSDGTQFSDGTSYADSHAEAFLASAISTGAANATFDYAWGTKLIPGQTFSIDHRAYRVRSVVSTNGDLQTVTFTPPAREFHDVGARVEIDRPDIRMKLARDDAMRLDLDHGEWSFPSVEFVEDL